jgi:toxin ParE1/3/4
VRQKPVIPRAQAVRDVQDAVDFYFGDGAEKAALGFVDALERAYLHIGRHPATASHRYAHELGLPSLRSWPLARYPYLIFFLERDDHPDVWRVLHGHRDLPAGLTSDL